MQWSAGMCFWVFQQHNWNMMWMDQIISTAQTTACAHFLWTFLLIFLFVVCLVWFIKILKYIRQCGFHWKFQLHSRVMQKHMFELNERATQFLRVLSIDIAINFQRNRLLDNSLFWYKTRKIKIKTYKSSYNISTSARSNTIWWNRIRTEFVPLVCHSIWLSTSRWRQRIERKIINDLNRLLWCWPISNGMDQFFVSIAKAQVKCDAHHFH